jgi:trehalose-phosphatase
VTLPARVRDLLQSLAARPGVALGITSGRRIADLEKQLGLGSVFYVGLHGLEVAGPGFACRDDVALRRYADRLQDVATALARSVGSVAGVRVEHKGPAIAVHTRRAGSGDAVWARLRLLNAAFDLVNDEVFRVVRGNEVLEIVPNVGRSAKLKFCATDGARLQACAVSLERRHGRGVFTVYVGDDVVDDDAFDAIQDGAIGAVVGKRPSKARYRLEGPQTVVRLIEMLGVPPA